MRVEDTDAVCIVALSLENTKLTKGYRRGLYLVQSMESGRHWIGLGSSTIMVCTLFCEKKNYADDSIKGPGRDGPHAPYYQVIS